MFKNYLKMAVRNLIKHKRYSLINILGLAIGLACFILIMLWVQDELSYDCFHKNVDHIYMVLRTDYGKTTAHTSKLLAPTIKDEIPEIIDATSFVSLPESFRSYLQYKEKGFEENFCLIEPQFFNIFSFNFKAGNPESACLNPNSIVLTERMKQKYFGDKNALGESLNLTLIGQQQTMIVTGILENMPHNSHIQRDIFIPMSFFASLGINWDNWNDQSPYTYILTKNAIDISDVETKIANCERTHSSNEKLHNLNYSLFPLRKIHLHSSAIALYASTGDIKYVYIFTIIAGIVLLIASMNYMNLSTALSLKRIKEIGIQKVVGANRIDLIRQYFGETLLLTFIALGGALVLVHLSLPVINRLIEKSLSVSYSNPQILLMLFVIPLVTGIISGSYPAIFISGFQPIRILKGKFHAGPSGLNLRKSLIIFQFTLSIIIIICTITVFSQLAFVKNSNLGYDKENIVCIRIKGNIHGQYDAFKDEILKNTDILSITRSEPLDISTMTKTDDIQWPGKDENTNMSICMFFCDCDFASTYKIKMHVGRFYSEQFLTDITNAYVINEAAVEAMGFETPIGQEITLWGRMGNIIGVTNDFHYASFHNLIEPLIFIIPNEQQQIHYFRQMSVRLKPNSIHQSMAYLERTWKSFFPGESFSYYFRLLMRICAPKMEFRAFPYNA